MKKSRTQSNPLSEHQIEELDKQLLKYGIKHNDLTIEIEDIMQKHNKMAMEEADKKIKLRARLNKKLFDLRKAKQKLCKHENITWSDISNTYKEKKCTKCYKVLEYVNEDTGDVLK